MRISWYPVGEVLNTTSPPASVHAENESPRKKCPSSKTKIPVAGLAGGIEGEVKAAATYGEANA